MTQRFVTVECDDLNVLCMLDTYITNGTVDMLSSADFSYGNKSMHKQW